MCPAIAVQGRRVILDAVMYSIQLPEQAKARLTSLAKLCEEVLLTWVAFPATAQGQ